MSGSKLIFIFGALLFYTMVNGQDSIKIESLLSIDTRGQHNISALNKNFDCFNCITGQVEDNPFHHLAVYSGINHTLVLNEKYVIETGIYLEERSHSGGNNTLSNLVVFPKILIKAEDVITRNGRMRYLIKGGDLWNEDIGDMLRIYNLDYQGILTKISLDQWSLGFMTIGDLSINVGLDLHQLYKFSLEYETEKYKNQTSFTINELVTGRGGNHPTATDFNIGNYSILELSANSTIEGQLDLRLNDELDPSLALGLRYQYSKEKIRLKSSLRYYSENFNFAYNGDGPRYYGLNSFFIGPQLYPLKNFYRSPSQWALYTHSGISDLLTFEITGSWTKKIYNRLSGFCDLDFNYLYDLKEGEGEVYPIYNLGIQVDFLPVFNGRISMTNGHMELRNFYQTIAISRAPFLALGFNIKLDKVRLGSKYLKL